MLEKSSITFKIFIALAFFFTLSCSKLNKYQSIHTAIIGPNKRPIEIQLRTMQMHEFAERGIASHWKYKSSEKFSELSWKI